MENHQSRLTGVKTAFFSMFVLGTLFLAGCQTIQMPDVSNYNLGLFEKNTITIKQGYSKVNIRPTPSTSQKAIATVSGGDILELLEERGNWLNVELYDTAGNKKSGWVYKYLVVGYQQPADESGETEPRDISDPPASENTQPTENEQQPTPKKDISIL